MDYIFFVVKKRLNNQTLKLVDDKMQKLIWCVRSVRKIEGMNTVQKKSFGFQIILIFLIPALVMLYFAYYFIAAKYETLKASELYIYASKNVQAISRLIHNIQLERGMSAGYLVLENEYDKKRLKKKLLSQQQMSDASYRMFTAYIDDKSEMKQKLDDLLQYKNKKFERNVIRLFYDISQIRNAVLSHRISFEEEIGYYSKINRNLLNLVYVLLTHFDKNYGNLMDIYRLEELKEIEGLERAYVYNYLLSKNKKLFARVRELFIEEKKFTNEYLSDASMENTLLYNKIVERESQQKVEKFEKALLNERLSEKDAAEWFKISTERIDELEKLSLYILEKYYQNVHKVYKVQKKALYWTVFVWMMAIVSLMFMLYILIKLLRSHAKMLEDLRIASYTFDSQEAVTITDPNGKIIRVNNAFSEITGYSEDEVIGKKPNILKSGRHSEKFYQNMWDALHTKGKWSGEIYNKRKNGVIYPERLSITAIKDDNDVTTHYIAQFIDISELKEAEENAKFQAGHDFLTKLPNRKSMIERLEEETLRAQRHGYLDAFFFLDLDGFKKINDNYGHHIGDEILVEVAKRLRETVRDDDYIARISGDEFCVMLLDIGKNESHAAHTAKIVSEKIIDAVSKVFEINEHRVYLGVSIGIKLFPDGIKDAYEIINSADAAMYKAKEAGKNRYVFFNDAIDAEIREISILKQEIKDAFLEREFVFYIQPKVKTADESVVGGEMLLRWQHPQRGLLYPGDFLKVIKEMGKLKEIGMMGVERACRFLTKHGPIEGTLSVNVSTYDLISNDFIDFVVKTVLECGIEPGQIEFEILENELIEEFELVQNNLEKLKTVGIKISIDDFGTGYSSIGYLRRLSLDALKIDRYFVQDIDNETTKELVSMIVGIAKTLRLDLIVEGVETKEQLERIRFLGIDYAQGFYFGKAVKEEEFVKLLK